MRILLLGKNGQLGTELQCALAPLGQLTAWGREQLDLTQAPELYAQVMHHAPDIIVNAAAYTAVDSAEQNVALAHAINADAPKALAQAARALGCRLIHYSTDYVFDGSGSRAWTETDACNPLNVYGQSKRAGEQAIEQSGCDYWILRTSWVYSAHGQNFAKTMLRLACERTQLQVVHDQIGAPTASAWLAELTGQILARQAKHPIASGIYHASACGETSWLGYAQYLFAKARELGFPLRLPEHGLTGVTSSQYPSQAPRPLNSRLDCSKLAHTLDLSIPPWTQGLDDLLQALKP